MVCGLSQANADHACLWCIVHKNERHDMSYPEAHWNGSKMARTIEKMKKKTKGKTFGMKALPIFDIEIDRCVPDELHLLLRIGMPSFVNSHPKIM